MSLKNRIRHHWIRLWMHHAGLTPTGRLATRLAELLAPPYKGRKMLAGFGDRGYVASTASVYGVRLKLDRRVYIGDQVQIFGAGDGGDVAIGEGSALHRGCIVEVGQGGDLMIGRDTHIQPNCQLSVYKGPLTIGDQVQIAPRCAFYPYNHRFEAGTPIKDQPLTTKGGIRIEDDAWLGYGVVVLDGVHIGRGAVVGANSVVTSDIPAEAVAVGAPARVIGTRPEPPRDDR